MSWYRKNPLFAAGMALCALIALGELALIYERWAASRAMAAKLTQRKAELQAMSQLTPAPTREIATQIESDLAKAQATLAAMQTELKGKGPAAERLRNAKVPTVRTEAYFDLATYIERMRELSRKHEVEIRPEASRFGFAAYANEAPVQDHIEPVFRQRLIAQFLIEALLEARPRALAAIKRERTWSKAEREARAQVLANGETPVDEPLEGPDYFVIDPRVSARMQGYLDATAFRLAFIGQTAALRNFLNRLAQFELPVLVREVEVDVATPEELAAAAAEEPPAGGDAATANPEAAAAPSVVLSAEPATGAPRGAAAPATKAGAAATARARPTAATPIVTKQLSRFTVTVEFIEIVPPAPPADAAAGTPPPPPS